MFDQVLINPKLIPNLLMDSIKIITSDGQVNFIGKNGAINMKRGSDHLPIVFTLKFTK